MLKPSLNTAFPSLLTELPIPEDAPMMATLTRNPAAPVTAAEAEQVNSWMRQYSLFQGLSAQQRDLIANKVLRVLPAIAWPSHLPHDEAVQVVYSQVFDALFGTVARSWISATSKLLWLRFPHEIVIFDSFVERAVTVLQWLEPSVQHLGTTLGSPPASRLASTNPAKFKADCVEFYMRFQTLVWSMYNAYRPQMQGLCAPHAGNPASAHPLRLFDRFLLSLGAP